MPSTIKTTIIAACLLVRIASTFTGEARYFEDPEAVPGTCGFSQLGAGGLGAAISHLYWANAAHCGRCIKVTTANGKEVMATVIDKCPGCNANDLDLFPETFAKLGSFDEGVLQVEWDFVPCSSNSPIQFHFKEDVNPQYCSLQVLNANVGVASLSISTDGGNTYQPCIRNNHNYFDKAGGCGSGPISVKVTSVNGDSIVVDDIAIIPDGRVSASSNFGGTSNGDASQSSTPITHLAAESPATPESSKPAFSTTMEPFKNIPKSKTTHIPDISVHISVHISATLPSSPTVTQIKIQEVSTAASGFVGPGYEEFGDEETTSSDITGSFDAQSTKSYDLTLATDVSGITAQIPGTTGSFSVRLSASIASATTLAQFVSNSTDIGGSNSTPTFASPEPYSGLTFEGSASMTFSFKSILSLIVAGAIAGFVVSAELA